MALIKCADCASEVSDAAPACPKCGRPVQTMAPAGEKVSPQQANTFLFATIGFALGFTLLWGGCGKFNKPDAQGLLVCSIAGGIVALVGGILGASLGKK